MAIKAHYQSGIVITRQAYYRLGKLILKRNTVRRVNSQLMKLSVRAHKTGNANFNSIYQLR